MDEHNHALKKRPLAKLGGKIDCHGRSTAHPEFVQIPIAPEESSYRNVGLLEWIVGDPEAIHFDVVSGSVAFCSASQAAMGVFRY